MLKKVSLLLLGITGYLKYVGESKINDQINIDGVITWIELVFWKSSEWKKVL